MRSGGHSRAGRARATTPPRQQSPACATTTTARRAPGRHQTKNATLYDFLLVFNQSRCCIAIYMRSNTPSLHPYHHRQWCYRACILGYYIKYSVSYTMGLLLHPRSVLGFYSNYEQASHSLQGNPHPRVCSSGSGNHTWKVGTRKVWTYGVLLYHHCSPDTEISARCTTVRTDLIRAVG